MSGDWHKNVSVCVCLVEGGSLAVPPCSAAIKGSIQETDPSTQLATEALSPSGCQPAHRKQASIPTRLAGRFLALAILLLDKFKFKVKCCKPLCAPTEGASSDQHKTFVSPPDTYIYISNDSEHTEEEKMTH